MTALTFGLICNVREAEMGREDRMTHIGEGEVREDSH